MVTVDAQGGLDDALRCGRPAIVEDGLLVARAEGLDVVVEATGQPEVGARFALEALRSGKHVVMVNVEADTTVGPYLRQVADRSSLVYTLVDGDQPGCIMNMVQWAETLGFEIVAAGRGTIFLGDDRWATPDTVPERFGFSEEMMGRRNINLKMYNSFRDGTKAQIEMTALANMTGLVPDIRGMHEPSVPINEIPRAFSLREEGGILLRSGVVELANSIGDDGVTFLENSLKMGVFVVIRTEHPFTQEDLTAYNLYPNAAGTGFLLYRPYHLVAVEAPISIARAALYGEATGSPRFPPVADVITVAKRRLLNDEILDGGGGYTVYGLCEKAEVTRAENLLPLGLAQGAQMRMEADQDVPITYDMVDLDEDSFLLGLRRQQDASNAVVAR